MSFSPLPDNARLWLLALTAAPAEAAQTELQQGLAEIVNQWRHKGQAYEGVCGLLHGQIIAVAEPNLAANPSGCAIDGMLRKVTRFVGERGLTLVDPAQEVLVRLGEELRPLPKASLGERLEDGTLNAATPVLDLALYSLGDLRSGHLEVPLASTWIARKYSVTAAQEA